MLEKIRANHNRLVFNWLFAVKRFEDQFIVMAAPKNVASLGLWKIGKNNWMELTSYMIADRKWYMVDCFTPRLH